VLGLERRSSSISGSRPVRRSSGVHRLVILHRVIVCIVVELALRSLIVVKALSHLLSRRCLGNDVLPAVVLVELIISILMVLVVLVLCKSSVLILLRDVLRSRAWLETAHRRVHLTHSRGVRSLKLLLLELRLLRGRGEVRLIHGRVETCLLLGS